MDLHIQLREEAPPGARPVEVVERKGLGHPDSICDGIAESIGRRLSRHYLDVFGVVLHHNVDKILLCAGAAAPAFGGGEVLEPIEIYLGGRATDVHRGVRIPVHELAVAACRDWLRAHIRFLDVDRDVKITSRLRPGSTDLARLFQRGTARALANDTSCGAGFAPPTDLERVVLAVERSLNSRETKASHPELGEDVKVMGVRRDARIQLTIGCAFVGRYVPSLDDYRRKKESAATLAVGAARDVTALPVQATVNAADDLDAGDVYLTVTGVSAEAGDDGQVGRGNRVSGLITPYRPMTIEASAGKNPVTHVGKLYNLVASRIAATIARDVKGIQDATCILVSQIGRPVDDPQLVDVGLLTEAGGSPLEASVTEIVRAELAHLDQLTAELLSERTPGY